MAGLCRFCTAPPGGSFVLLLFFIGAGRVVPVGFDSFPMRIGTQVWVFVAPLVSLLFHVWVVPFLYSVMVTARPIKMGTVAVCSVCAESSLRMGGLGSAEPYQSEAGDEAKHGVISLFLARPEAILALGIMPRWARMIVSPPGRIFRIELANGLHFETASALTLAVNYR